MPPTDEINTGKNTITNYSAPDARHYSATSPVACEGFNDWGGRGYDDFVPGEVTKTAPSGNETT